MKDTIEIPFWLIAASAFMLLGLFFGYSIGDANGYDRAFKFYLERSCPTVESREEPPRRFDTARRNGTE